MFLIDYWQCTYFTFYGLFFISMHLKEIHICKASKFNSNALGEYLEERNTIIQYGYDEYPVVVPKRTNLLQHASKEDIKQEPYFIDRAVGLPQWQSVMSRVQKIGRLKRKYRITKFSSDEPTEEISIQRRAYSKASVYPGSSISSRLIDVVNKDTHSSLGSGERIYWRCYFNAISCF